MNNPIIANRDDPITKYLTQVCNELKKSGMALEPKEVSKAIMQLTQLIKADGLTLADLQNSEKNKLVVGHLLIGMIALNNRDPNADPRLIHGLIAGLVKLLRLLKTPTNELKNDKQKQDELNETLNDVRELAMAASPSMKKTLQDAFDKLQNLEDALAEQLQMPAPAPHAHLEIENVVKKYLGDYQTAEGDHQLGATNRDDKITDFLVAKVHEVADVPAPGAASATAAKNQPAPKGVTPDVAPAPRSPFAIPGTPRLIPPTSKK